MTESRETTECWQCGRPAAHSLFCRYCDSLQRPASDYFRFFGLEPKFRIDLEALRKRFYELSRLLHPDRYMRRSATEQQFSLEAAAILNDAWRVLRDPVLRAEYRLRQLGYESGEARAQSADPELLEEVFELNLALEELRAGERSALPHLTQARERFLARRGHTDARLEELFAWYDESGSREALAAIRRLLDRRKYIQNMIEQVERELENADADVSDRF